MKLASEERQKQLRVWGMLTFRRDIWVTGMDVAYPLFRKLHAVFLNDMAFSQGKGSYHPIGAIVHDATMPAEINGMPCCVYRPTLRTVSAETQRAMKKEAKKIGLGVGWQVANKSNHGEGWHFEPCGMGKNPTSRIFAMLFVGLPTSQPHWAQVSQSCMLTMIPEGTVENADSHDIFTWLTNDNIVKVRKVSRFCKITSYGLWSKRCKFWRTARSLGRNDGTASLCSSHHCNNQRDIKLNVPPGIEPPWRSKN